MKNLKLTKTSLLLLGVLVAACSLNSCAYTETMNERSAERGQLQSDLNLELERGARLTR